IHIKGTLPFVLGNEPALAQILVNLLANAVKFVPPATIPRVCIWAELKDARVQINIEDNGIGIDPRNHERIFKMFERVNSPKEYEGTGIGLAIVKKAVERLGGEVG